MRNLYLSRTNATFFSCNQCPWCLNNLDNLGCSGNWRVIKLYHCTIAFFQNKRLSSVNHTTTNNLSSSSSSSCVGIFTQFIFMVTQHKKCILNHPHKKRLCLNQYSLIPDSCLGIMNLLKIVTFSNFFIDWGIPMLK